MFRYCLTDETMVVQGHDSKDIILHRIKALCDIPSIGVKAGDLGGWIEKTANLDLIGTAWVGGEAQVYERASVGGDALVADTAKVYGSARIFDSAIVDGASEIYGDARIYHCAKVSDSEVAGAASICGHARIYGNCRIFDAAVISHNAEVFDEAEVSGGVLISDSVRFHGGAMDCGYTIYRGNEEIVGHKVKSVEST